MLRFPRPSSSWVDDSFSVAAAPPREDMPVGGILKCASLAEGSSLEMDGLVIAVNCVLELVAVPGMTSEKAGVKGVSGV